MISQKQETMVHTQHIFKSSAKDKIFMATLYNKIILWIIKINQFFPNNLSIVVALIMSTSGIRISKHYGGGHTWAV
jgi:hypothetical protein